MNSSILKIDITKLKGFNLKIYVYKYNENVLPIPLSPINNISS